MYLVAGLGNPGARYHNTPHNAGFIIVDEWAHKLGVEFRPSNFSGDLATLSSPKRLLLLKPSTYMNLSGESVGALARYYKIPSERVLIIHDDVDVPFGKVKTRKAGGAGGHNGIRSIIQHLGTESFARIKLGVGKPSKDFPVAVKDWVLSPMGPERLAELKGPMLEEVLLRIDQWFKSLGD